MSHFFHHKRIQQPRKRPILAPFGAQNPGSGSFQVVSQTPIRPLPPSPGLLPCRDLSGGYQQRCDSAHRAPEQPPRQADGPLLLGPGKPPVNIEETYIRLTIEHVDGNRNRAAEMLGISLRTLQNRIATLREEAKTTTPGS